jgi:peroxiredoxin
LWWILAITAGVFIYLLHANWYWVGYPYAVKARAWLDQRARERQFARFIPRDPLLGTRLTDVMRNSANGGSGKEVSQARVVIFGGPLGSCCTGESTSIAQLFTDTINTQGGHGNIGVVLVLGAPHEAVQQFVKTRRLNFAVVADPEGKLAQTYNAFWTPRAYILVNGHLRWIQKQERLDEQGVQAAISQIKSRKEGSRL